MSRRSSGQFLHNVVYQISQILILLIPFPTSLPYTASAFLCSQRHQLSFSTFEHGVVFCTLLTLHSSPHAYLSRVKIMQKSSTEEVLASIPMEITSGNPNLNQSRTFTVRRKAATRTFPWDLAEGELNAESSPTSPQAEGILATQEPMTKKRRLKKPLSASADEDNATKISPDGFYSF
jgi:hypothetical protein